MVVSFTFAAPFAVAPPGGAASPPLRTPPPRSDTAYRTFFEELAGTRSSAIRHHDSVAPTAPHLLKRAKVRDKLVDQIDREDPDQS
jgi:hypothetical protein